MTVVEIICIIGGTITSWCGTIWLDRNLQKLGLPPYRLSNDQLFANLRVYFRKIRLKEAPIYPAVFVIGFGTLLSSSGVGMFWWGMLTDRSW